MCAESTAQLQSGSDTSPADPRGVAQGPSIGQRAVAGATWTLLFALGNKGITLCGQLILAYLLAPADFGVVALALSLASAASLLGESGIRQLLVTRQTRFEQDASEAFWLSLAIHAVGAAVVAGLAPLAARWFGEPPVTRLMLILVPVIPLQALPTIYAAKLYIDLRFRTRALIHFLMGVLQTVSAVVLAIFGFGALSLILPLIWVSLFSAIAHRWAVGRIPLYRPHPRLWAALLLPSLWLMASALQTTLNRYGVSFVIGLHQHLSSAVVGTYFMGFLLSSQLVFLLATNLRNVLYPTLTKLNEDPQRQYRGLQTAARTMMLLAVPACVLQMTVAEPAIRLLPERWSGTSEIVFWLSCGLISQPLAVLAASVFLARGGYRWLTLATTLQSGCTLFAAYLGGLVGDGGDIAFAVMVALWIGNVGSAWVAWRILDGSARDLLAAVWLPIVLGIVTACLALAVLAQLQEWNPWMQLIAATCLVSLSYTLQLRWAAPQLLQELVDRFRTLLRRGQEA